MTETTSTALANCENLKTHESLAHTAQMVAAQPLPCKGAGRAAEYRAASSNMIYGAPAPFYSSVERSRTVWGLVVGLPSIIIPLAVVAFPGLKRAGFPASRIQSITRLKTMPDKAVKRGKRGPVSRPHDGTATVSALT